VKKQARIREMDGIRTECDLQAGNQYSFALELLAKFIQLSGETVVLTPIVEMELLQVPIGFDLDGRKRVEGYCLAAQVTELNSLDAHKPSFHLVRAWL
jgi:hypothetical protein